VASGELRSRRPLTDLEQCEQAVLAAAREERAARSALEAGIRPLHPEWCETDDEGYQARLARWRTASHTLVEGLNRLRSARASTRKHARIPSY
jgi:uncharacterized protein YukE